MNRFHVSQIHAVALALSMVFAALSGCSPASSKERAIRKADAFFAKSEYERAEIEYLNALKIDSNDAHALSRLGIVFFEQGRTARAFPFLKRALELNPADAVSRTKLAVMYLSVGARNDAIAEASAVLQTTPSSLDAPIVLAEASISGEQAATANALFDAMPQAIRESPPILVAKGILLARSTSSNQAAVLFERASTANPPYAPAFSALGSVYLARNETAKADAFFAKASELSDARSPRRIQYALFKFKSGDVPGAKAVLQAILARTPDNFTAMLRLTELAITENKLDEADRILEAALRRDGAHPEVLSMAVRLAMSRGDSEKALAKAISLTTLFPQSLEAHCEMAKIYAVRGEFSNAVDSLNRALAINPEYKDALVLLGSIDVQQGNNSAAVTTLRKLLEKHPQLVEAHFVLAEAYRGLKDFQSALAVYTTLEAIPPVDPRVYFLKGLTLRQLKRNDAARTAFEQAASVNPTSLKPLEQLSEIDMQEGKQDRAQKRLEAAIASRPKDAELYVLLGRLKFFRGNPSQAEMDLRKAIEFDPNQVSAYTLLAKIYLDSNDVTRAMENLKEVQKRNPKDTGALLMLGSIHEQQKQYTSARDAYGQALLANAQFAPALNNLANLYLTQFNDVEKAYQYARRAREASPSDPVVADTMGWTLHKRGEYATALPFLLEAVAKLQDSAEVQYHLAMNYYMTGQESEAKLAFESALTKKGTFPEIPDIQSRLNLLNADTAASSSSAETLERYVTSNPKDTFALARLAAIYARTGSIDKAITTQEAVVKLNPQSARNTLALAQMYQTKGDFAKSADLARAARKISPDDFDIIVLSARLASQTRDHTRAYSLYSEASRKRPGDATLLSELAGTAYAVGRISEAKIALIEALKVAPSSDESERLELMEKTTDTRSTAGSVHLAQKRLSKLPDDLPSQFVLALNAGDGALVRASLLKLVEAYPDFAPAQRVLTILFSSEPINDAKAEAMGTKARIHYPNDSELAKALGFIVFRQSDFRRSLTLLESAKKDYSADPTMWYYLGMSQDRLKMRGAAKESLQKALDLGLAGALADSAKAILSSEKG